MGCTASRPEFEDQYPELLQQQQQQQQQQDSWHHSHAGRGNISMAATQNPSLLHDFNLVPLSSSFYGVNMRSGQQDERLTEPPGYGGPSHTLEDKNPMKDMLQMLESLDMGTSEPSYVPPNRTNQVSSILEDLKPGLERHLSQALGKPFAGQGSASPALPLSGKENARPVAPSSPRLDAVSSPISQGGSASPTVKTSKSKSSFASRFLKRSSSALGSQKHSRNRSKDDGSQKHNRNPSKDDVDDDVSESAHAALQSAKGKDGSMLFDSDFLDSYESALKELSPEDWNSLKDGENQRQHDGQVVMKEDEEKPQPGPAKAQPVQKRIDPLEKFEKLCPPGGENSVVLYTTSLRGIRKTFEDCNSLRSVLESFQVSVDERDVAMHQGFRNELREMMGNKPVPVPRLFIKGCYIGGAEEVLQLHEEGQVAPLLEGLPRDQRGSAHPCDGCGGARFVPCLECSGSRKVVNPDNLKEVVRCPDCNENGLIQCPICC